MQSTGLKVGIGVAGCSPAVRLGSGAHGTGRVVTPEYFHRVAHLDEKCVHLPL